MSTKAFKNHSQLSKIAAKWFIRMQEAAPDSTERIQFEAWLLQSPQHQQEYASISEAWHGIDSVDELKKLAEAKQSAETQAFFNKTKRTKKIKNAAATLAVFLAFGLAGLIGYQQYQHWQAAPVMQLASQSNTAEIITQTLDDGSQVILNAKSQIQVTFYRNQRHVALLKGEAIFNVQKDANRPFVVETVNTKITVLGTRFAVNKLSQLERISVDHGRVQIETKQPFSKMILQNGQVAEIYNGKAVQSKNSPAEDYFKFATGSVIFNQANIVEIAEVLSRYRHKNVLSQGNSTEKLSAVFQIKDTESFIDTLPKIANVQLISTPNSTIIQAK